MLYFEHFLREKELDKLNMVLKNIAFPKVFFLVLIQKLTQNYSNNCSLSCQLL